MSDGFDWAKLGDVLGEIAADLRLQPKVLIDLPFSDPWSFAIKVNALLEATLTEIILRSLGDPRLEEPIARLNVLGSHGKIAFCRALGVFDSQDLAFIEALAQVRTRVVHDIRNTASDFGAYVAGFPPSDQPGLLRRLVPRSPDDDARRKLFAFNPVLTIWISLVPVLVKARLHWIGVDDRRRLTNLSETFAVDALRFAEEAIIEKKEGGPGPEDASQ